MCVCVGGGRASAILVKECNTTLNHAWLCQTHPLYTICVHVLYTNNFSQPPLQTYNNDMESIPGSRSDLQLCFKDPESRVFCVAVITNGHRGWSVYISQGQCPDDGVWPTVLPHTEYMLLCVWSKPEYMFVYAVLCDGDVMWCRLHVTCV